MTSDTKTTSAHPNVNWAAPQASAGSEHDTAILVDPHSVEAMAEAMRRLDQDETLRTDLATRGSERASSPAFSWERAARQALAAYRDDRAAFLAEAQPLAVV